MNKRFFGILLCMALLFSAVPIKIQAAVGTVEEQVWVKLRDLGYSEGSTAGIMANAQAESSMRPDSHSKNVFTEGTGGYGLFGFEVAHWNTSYQGYKYKKWLEDHGHPWESWATVEYQLEYMFGNGKGFETVLKSKANGKQYANKQGNLVGWPKHLSLDDFKKLDDPREAADFFLMVYERPANPICNGKRADYASRFYEKYAKYKVDIEKIAVITSGVKVSWEAYPKAKYYAVYQSVNGGKYKKVATTTKLSYVAKGVGKGGSYRFYINALNSRKKKIAGNRVTARSIELKAAPKNPDLKKASDGFGLTWEVSAETAGYRIQQKIGSGEWETMEDVTEATFQVKSLKMGKKYSYRIFCVDSNGMLISGASKTVDGVFVTPTELTAVRKSLSNSKNSIRCSWEAVAGAKGYQIQYATNPEYKNAKTVNIVKGSAESYTITKPKAGKTYYIRIRTRKKVGSKTYSSVWDKEIVR